MATLYDIPDIALELGMNRQTLWRRWKDGELPSENHTTKKGVPLWTEAGVTRIAVRFAAHDGPRRTKGTVKGGSDGQAQ